MNEVIKKFNEYLDTCISHFKRMGNEGLLKNYLILKNYFFSLEDYSNNKIGIYPYGILSDALSKSPLSIEEQITVLLYVIKSQLNRIINSKIAEIDLDKIEHYDFKYITPQEFSEALLDESIYSILKRPLFMFNPSEKERAREFKEAFAVCVQNGSGAVNNHVIMRDNFFAIYPSLSISNIEKFIKALNKSGVGSIITNELRTKLMQEISPKLEKENEQSETKLSEKLQQKIERLTISRSKNEKKYLETRLDTLSKLSYLGISIENMELSFLYSWFRYPSSAKRSRTIFDYFQLLDQNVLNGTFNTREKAELIFFIIKNNIDYGILDSMISLKEDSKLTSEENFPNLFECITLPEVYLFPYVFALLRYNTKMNVNEEKRFIHALSDHMDLEGLTIFQDAHESIKIHYLDKKDSFDEKDIEYVLTALNFLKLPSNTLGAVSAYLNSKLNARLKKEQKVQKQVERARQVQKPKVKLYSVQAKKELKEYLDDNKNKALYRELQMYFDFDTMKAIRFLTPNEIDKCKEIAFAIGIDNRVISEFVRLINKYNRSIKPSSRYNHLTSYISKYKENPKIAELLKQIEEAIIEIRDIESKRMLIPEEITSDSLESLKSINGISEYITINPHASSENIIRKTQSILNEEEEFYQESIADDLDGIMKEIEQIKLSTSFNNGVLEKK